MRPFLNYRLIKDALKKLANTDYLAKAILDYGQEALNTGSKIRNLNNIKEIQDSISNLAKSSNYLIKMLKDELKEDVVKASSHYDINELTSLYILNNFMKLCPSDILLPYYERIYFLEKRFDAYFSVKMQLGIMLRASLIINKISRLQNKDALERFTLLLEKTKGFENNLLYVIYYGLFDGTINNNDNVDNDLKVDNENVFFGLLNNNQKLPDSIITELCVDNQFKDTDPDILLFIMSLFFTFKKFPKLEDDDMLDIIQKIFNNNVRDFNSKAEFLDLGELIKQIEDYFLANKSGFERYLVDIVNGIEILDRREDNKGYGTV